MQFQVPQFIETEDKVVGPFSLRQFLYIGIAAFVCAILYFFVAVWLFVIGSVVIMGIAVAVAFVKVNGQPFIKLMSAAAGYYWKPQSYIWKPLDTAPAQQAAPAKTAHKAAAPSGGIDLETIASGIALHKSWETLQTGSPVVEKPKQRTSDREFIEKRMNERYQIFQKVAGDRDAARRVDYR
jgi:hypothetical protein